MAFAAAPAPVGAPDPDFARDVALGLTRRRKWLPARWLYDELGSALFDAITLLPEYGLTRADDRVIRRAAEEIHDLAGHPRIVLELGSGSGSKTRALLEAASRQTFVDYYPVDISRSALEACSVALSGIPRVNITPIQATYFEGMEGALAGRMRGERAIILFLGSTIGNFGRGQAGPFLQRLFSYAQPGDTLLIGADLVKGEETLVRAYNDSLGITAAFNLNLLQRMNRELGADFETARFTHQALWNARGCRVEMHLRARVRHRARIAAVRKEISFRAGETIWTESSHKFRPEQIRRLGERAGWRFRRQWTDTEWPFAETLFTA